MLQVSKRSKRFFAFLVGFMMIVGQSSYLSSNIAYAETNDSSSTDTVFMLTDTLEEGQNYIVASGDNGSVSIFENDSDAIALGKTEVISDDNGSYIKDVSKDAIWTAQQDNVLVNGENSVELEKSGGDSPAYVVLTEGSEATDNGEEVYLYVESEIETGVDTDATSERGPPEAEEPAEEPAVKAAAKAISLPDNTVLAFTSDTHNKEGDVAANRLGSWLDTVAGIYGGVTLMAFGGDMANASASESAFWTLTQADMDQLSQRSVQGVYTTGNHEYSPGNFTSGKNSTTQVYIENKQGAEGENYHIYCLGSSAYAESSGGWMGGWNTYSSSQISTLNSYLNSITDNKPIFIITHYPLHYTTSRTISGAGDIIDTLNAAASSGKKITYLWGHNHTDAPRTETNYDKIFIPGDTLTYNNGQSKEIQFYYGAAGCMSDSEYGTGSGSIKGKGLVVTINNKDQLSFKYHTSDGQVVEGERASYTEQDPVDIESVSITETSASVEVGKTVQLHTTIVPADGTVQSKTWSSSNSAVATVDSTGKVKGISAGNATITVTVTDKSGKKATFTASVEVEVTPRNVSGTVYVLTDTLEPDKNYIIANKNDGEAYALTNNNGSVSLTTVEVEGEVITTEDENLVFTTGGSGSTVTSMENDGRYLSASNSSLTLATSAPSNRTFAYGSDSKLTVRSGNSTYYIYYSTYNGGRYTASTSASSSSSPREVYLFEEVKEQVAVTGVTVEPSTSTIEAKKTVQLTANVQPANATNKKVNWSSSNTDAATVDANGKVKGVAEGTATITATTVDGGKTATATVTVTPSTSTETHYVIMVDGNALTYDRSPNTANGGSSSYTYTGLAGTPLTSASDAADNMRFIFEETDGGYYIMDTDGYLF